MQVRFLPPQLERKGKPTGDGSRLENGRAMSLEGSTSSPSAFLCPWPSGEGTGLPNQPGGFDSHRALSIGDRLTGRLPGFEPGDEGSTPSPRTLASAAVSRRSLISGRLLTGRTSGSEPTDVGSTPAPGTPCRELPLFERVRTNSSSWSSLECSPPCHGGDRGFKSHRGRSKTRYANWQSGQAQTLVNVCGFKSHPCH